MKNLFFIFLSLITTIASAQNCDESTLLQTPGRWKIGMKGSQGGSAADLQKEKKLIDAIHSMITTKYSPTGLEAIYHGSFNPPYPNMPANSYSYSIIPLKFYCEGNNIKTEHETSSYFSINANFFEAEIYDTAQGDRAMMEGFNVLSALPVQKDGYWYFKEKNVTLAFGLPGKTSMWLITYDNKLPYAYVTKKEFLEKRKLNLARIMAEETGHLKEVLKNKEIEKGYKETEYKNDPAKFAQYMKMDYNSVKERYEKLLADVNKKYQPAFEKIEKQLKASSEELNQAAIVRMDPQDHLSYLFTDEKDAFGRILIKPNPSYFNKKLPRSTPQFFWIYIIGSHVDPIPAKFMKDIINAVDFTALKSMLGKEPENANPQNKLAQTKPAPTKQESRQNSTVDIYKNKPSPGFVPTPVTQIKNAVVPTSPVNSAIKNKVLAINLNPSSIPSYLNQILADLEKSLDQQQKKNTELLFAKFKTKAIDLADAGVMLYYKGAVKEGLWCLAKAAAMKPEADYILSNLTGIMNLADAELRALPILRYLKDRHPNSTTILNNLGQAWYMIGELNRSEAVLDSCLRIAAYHPQANLTKAAIDEKKGRNGEAADHIQKSLRGAYTENAHEFAKRKGIKLDYSNILNRYRPTSAEYINPRKYQPPPQCTNVFETAKLEAQWDEYTEALKDITTKINGGLNESSEKYGRQMQEQVKNRTTTSVFSLGPLYSKAEKLYKIYLDQAAALQEEATFYLEHTFKNDHDAIENEYSSSIEIIEKKYGKMSGEGKGSYAEARCAELNAAMNAYLSKIAAIKNAYIGRFAKPLQQLNIEMMYWSQLMPGPTGFREMLYYERAIFAVNALNIKSNFLNPCNANSNETADKYVTDLPEPFCPITFKFKIAVAKITGDCSKFEIELEFEGLILNLERDFKKKTSTIAFGAGISAQLNEETVSKEVMEFVDFGGAGVGVKAQGFIEIDGNGISDFGLRGEGAIEGVFTDKGDLKINGKIGVNSGVDISTSEGVQTIGKILNAF